MQPKELSANEHRGAGGPFIRSARALDRTGIAAIAAFLLGCAVRLAYAFPVHKYPADADCLNSGLRAFRILEGRFPVFYTTVRIGAFECYLHAAAFSIFGVSRFALALAPILSGCLLLAVFYMLCRALLGPVAGCIALLLLALPPPAYLFWTYMPNCYAETMLFCGATLWMADMVTRRGARPWSAFGLGVSIGLGWWNSLQTLGSLIPSMTWVGLKRAEVLRRARFLLIALAGFVLGALPWIAYNIRHPFASFRNNFAARPASGLREVLSNAAYLVSYSLRELVASVDPENGPNPPNLVQRLLRGPVVVIYVAALVFTAFAIAAWLRRRVRGRNAGPAPGWLLLVLTAAAVCALAVASEAGQRRGLMVRYILPLYLPIAGLAAVFFAEVARRSRSLAVGLLLVLITFNFSGYYFSGTPTRQRWQEKLESDRRLLDFLRSRDVDAVCGNYWLAYPINFLSREMIRGIPTDLELDYYDYAADLGEKPRRWALLAQSRSAVEKWARRAGLGGEMAAPAPGYFVFLPAAAPSEQTTPDDFLARILAASPRRGEAAPPRR